MAEVDRVGEAQVTSTEASVDRKVLATNRQLWRLNQLGMLSLVDKAEPLTATEASEALMPWRAERDAKKEEA